MVLLFHLQSSGTEIRGIWILPFCVGDRARASKGCTVCTTPLAILSTLYTTFRVLYSPLYQAAMQAYLLSTIEEKSWAQMNKNTLFLV